LFVSGLRKKDETRKTWFFTGFWGNLVSKRGVLVVKLWCDVWWIRCFEWCILEGRKWDRLLRFIFEVKINTNGRLPI